MARNYADQPKATAYLKLFVDCLEKYQKLNDSEFGRLVRAALRYKATGAEPDDLGREALLWDGMKLDIDRDNEKYVKTAKARSEAGKAGAIARWQSNKEYAIERWQSNKEYDKNGKCHVVYGKNGQDKDKDKDKDKDNVFPHVVREYRAGARVEQPTTPPNSGGSDPVAAVLADFLDRINPAASSACLDELRTFAEEMGEAVCKRAFDIALDAKKASWPYIRAILRDKHKRGIKCLADWEASEKTEEKPDAKASEIGRAAIRKLIEEANL